MTGSGSNGAAPSWGTATATDVGLSNVTNNKQIPGLSTGTTSGHLVTWGTDGYTVADGGAIPTLSSLSGLSSTGSVTGATSGIQNFTNGVSLGTAQSVNGTAKFFSAYATTPYYTSITASSANTANAKIADVSTDVGGVKTQVSATQAELQKTIADLKSTRGDLGVQSGLIATNAQELQALKRLGERTYTEFKLGKTKVPQRVGDITLKLKSVDAKKNRYTIEVNADDKLTEKSDKNLNEPVQFYTSKARQPYEIVVNQVQKDMIVGYLSTPKEQSSR